MKEVFSKAHLILFDLDGLLVDTEPLHHKAVFLTLCDYGISPTLTFQEYIGLAHAKSGLGVKEYIFNHHPEMTDDWETFRNKKKVHYLNLLKTSPPSMMEGATETILNLEKRAIPMCVVTNSGKREVDLLKAALPGLNKISTWITREDYAHPKPSPDGYLKALSLFPKIPKEFALGFEDSLRGAHALLSAGIKPILVSPADHPQLKDKGTLCHIFSLIEL